MKNLQRNSFAKQKETAIGLKIGKEETELDRHGDNGVDKMVSEIKSTPLA